MNHTSKPINQLPSARKLKRDCSRELYRAIKRMKIYVASDKIEKAEQYYAGMVATHYLHIQEMRQQRKKQIDWWIENCSKKLAELLEVDHALFVQAFKNAYLGLDN